MDNLIIGESSQLAHYFPADYVRISSRNIDFNFLKKKWDKVFLLFAEQRTFKNDSSFLEINFELTRKVVDRLLNNANKIYLFSTSELWNMYSGPINLNLPFNFDSTPYIESKKKLCNYINSNRSKYRNVVIIYPFNFNSVHRKQGFLFHKVYDSILFNRQYQIGNVNFERDLLHASTVVERTLMCQEDTIIGSGLLVNVKNFIEDVYKSLNLDISKYLKFEDGDFLSNKRNSYYNQDLICDYNRILELTVSELKEKMNQNYND